MKQLARLIAGIWTLNLGPAEGAMVKDDSPGNGTVPVRSLRLKPYRITGAVTLTEADHAGRLGVFDVAAGAIVTLPRSTGSGAIYRFFVKTTITSNAAKVQVGNADDVIQGTLATGGDGSASEVMRWSSAAGSDTISGNGSTTGGIRGDYYEIEDAAEGVFSIRGVITATGTEATPFSSAV